MASRLFNTESLTKMMLLYCWLDPGNTFGEHVIKMVYSRIRVSMSVCEMVAIIIGFHRSLHGYCCASAIHWAIRHLTEKFRDVAKLRHRISECQYDNGFEQLSMSQFLLKYVDNRCPKTTFSKNVLITKNNNKCGAWYYYLNRGMGNSRSKVITHDVVLAPYTKVTFSSSLFISQT